jgi:integrase
MGRKSPFNLPFLVRRADSGRFLYSRHLKPDIAPYVAGMVTTPWDLSQRPIGGGQVIKIALDTSDLGLASSRWASIHPQVESYVNDAERAARPGKKAVVELMRVSGLTEAEIAAMAQQELHEILAAHDAEIITGNAEAPLLKAIQGILGNGGEGPVSKEGMVAAARSLAHRFAKQDLASRQLEGLTTDYETFGAVVPETTDLSFSGKAVPEKLLAVAHEAPRKRAKIIRGPVSRRLAANGIELPSGHPDRGKLALALARARVDATAKVLQRDEGAAIQTPPAPDPLMRTAEPLIPTLTKALENWKQKQDPRPKTVEEFTTWIGRFTSLHGDLGIDEIRKSHILEYRSMCLRLANAMPRNVAQGSLKEMVAWADKQETVQRLNRGTVNKAIRAVSAVLAVAEADEFIPSNPARNSTMRITDERTYAPYTDEELKKILAMPIYANQSDLPLRAGQWAARFIPLIGLFSGARLEEIAQLRCSDVVLDEGVPYLNITKERGKLSHEELLRSKGPQRKLKTISSMRVIPIHSRLVELGILDYLSARRAAGDVDLFPALRVTKTKRSAEFSKFWGAVCREHVTQDPDKVFHSFRHRFMDEIRATNDELVCDALLGYAKRKTSSRYGAGFQLEPLQVAVEKLSYPRLDFGHLVLASGAYR